MAYEPEGQGSIPDGNAGAFWSLGLPKAFSRYLQKEWGVCAETPATFRAYLCAVGKPAFLPQALDRGRGLSCAQLAI